MCSRESAKDTPRGEAHETSSRKDGELVRAGPAHSEWEKGMDTRTSVIGPGRSKKKTSTVARKGEGG